MEALQWLGNVRLRLIQGQARFGNTCALAKTACDSQAAMRYWHSTRKGTSSLPLIGGILAGGLM
jgi:hypothetical protein